MHEPPLVDAASDTVDIELADISSFVSTGASIDIDEIFEAQRAWANGVMDIGSLYVNGGDYVNRTQELVDSLYGYAESPVLFKPTLAYRHPFRAERNEAISYFIGGVVDEDLGFALRPWKHVRFGVQSITLLGTTAVSMGHYHFIDENSGQEIQVEFTFGYFRGRNGSVRINLHHSSLPYAPVTEAPGKS